MQRTTNNIGGDGGEKTSVKMHQPPGGQSSISFGDDQPVQQKQTSNRTYNPNRNQSSFQIGGYDEKPNNANPSVRVNQAPGGKSSITFGDDGSKPQQQPQPKQQSQLQQQSQQTQQNDAKTSVRVHNPPGGKSSITFG